MERRLLVWETGRTGCLLSWGDCGKNGCSSVEGGAGGQEPGLGHMKCILDSKCRGSVDSGTR